MRHHDNVTGAGNPASDRKKLSSREDFAAAIIGKRIVAIEWDNEAHFIYSIAGLVLDDGARVKFGASDHDNAVFLDITDGLTTSQPPR
jgi:hypothetical protein